MPIFLPILAADAPAGGGGDMFIMIGMIFLIFWFLVIRPGSKERKARENAVKALKKHDKVVTNAGIHGTVMSMDETSVVLRVDDKNNVRLKFSRAAIWEVLTAGSNPGKDDNAGRKDAGSKKDGAAKKADKYAGKPRTSKGDDASDADQAAAEAATS